MAGRSRNIPAGHNFFKKVKQVFDCKTLIII